jgi:hypothetical protein
LVQPGVQNASTLEPAPELPIGASRRMPDRAMVWNGLSRVLVAF